MTIRTTANIIAAFLENGLRIFTEKQVILIYKIKIPSWRKPFKP